jgi:hypothetical protein
MNNNRFLFTTILEDNRFHPALEAEIELQILNLNQAHDLKLSGSLRITAVDPNEITKIEYKYKETWKTGIVLSIN